MPGFQKRTVKGILSADTIDYMSNADSQQILLHRDNTHACYLNIDYFVTFAYLHFEILHEIILLGF